MSGEQYAGWVRIKHLGGGFGAIHEGDLGAKPPSAGLYYLDSLGEVRSIPLLNNNISSVSPDFVKVGVATNISITGSNFTGGTSFDFGSDVTINSFSVNSTTQATLNITAATTGDKIVQAGVYGDAEGSTGAVGVYTDIVTPGDGTTSWDNAVNVLTGNGTISKNAGGTAWDAGATFGSVSSGSDFVLTFSPTSSGAQKQIFGLVASYVDANWTDTQYGVYLGASSLSMTAIENGAIGSVIGSYATNDDFELRRVGTVVTLWKNGALVHTYADASSETILRPEVNIYNTGIGFNGASLRYR